LPIVVDGMGRRQPWDWPSSWSSWAVTAWLNRFPARRRVTLALLIVTFLGAAAAFGGARSTPLRESALGDSPAGAEAVGPAQDCRVRYQIERDWRTGFAAVVTVTNAGGTDLDAATLRFRFPGQQAIVSGERWQQDGREVRANLALPTGKTVRLPFTASYQEENPVPLAFLVDGMVCDAVVTGPRGDRDGTTEVNDDSHNSGPGPGPGGSGPGPGGSDHGKKGKKKNEDGATLRVRPGH
jgi:hypothetical protein